MRASEAGAVRAVRRRALMNSPGRCAGSSRCAAAPRRRRGMRPCSASQAGMRSGVSRKSGSRATSSVTSITQAGPTKRRGGNRVAGVVGQILAGDPVNRRVEVRAGVLAHVDRVPVPGRPLVVVARDDCSIVTPGDGAKIGGRPITGVVRPERLRQVDHLERAAVRAPRRVEPARRSCSWRLRRVPARRSIV